MIINHISVSTLPVLYRFGGAIERRIMETANEQARRGHEVHVYSVGDESETRLVNGVTYHFIKCRSKLPLKHIEFQYRIARALKRGPKGGVLHFHSQPEGALMSTFVSAKKILQYD
ncbi:MAG: glycosyltransferase, partial [Planctomycetes bacterium]|nr:glycosyltransferase [Planctomycetota bacterium]